MSTEESDYTYKPKKGTVCSGETTKRKDRSQRAARVNYTEVEISSGSAYEGTLEAYNLEAREIKSEREGSVPLLGLEGVEDKWTLGTLARTSSQLPHQFDRVTKENTELKMAREVEQGGLTQIMQMMMEMRAKDRKAEQERENSRVEREE